MLKARNVFLFLANLLQQGFDDIDFLSYDVNVIIIG